MEKGTRDYSITGIHLLLLSYEHIQDYLAMFSPVVRSLVNVSSVHAEQTYVLYRLAHNAVSPFFYAIVEHLSYQLVGALIFEIL